MSDLATKLSGRDRRSVGGSDAVVRAVLKQPEQFEALWALLRAPEPLVRMRAADALEKVTRERPDWLAPHKAELLGGTLDDGSREVRWHLIAMSARLKLDEEQARRLVSRLERALKGDESRIVRVMALQAIADLVGNHPAFAAELDRMIETAAGSPIPSLAARARKIARNRRDRG